MRKMLTEWADSPLKIGKKTLVNKIQKMKAPNLRITALPDGLSLLL